MSTDQTPTPHWWRLVSWNRNPLMRTSDRLDFAAVVVAVTFVLIMVPLASAFGVSTYSGLAEQSLAEHQDRHKEPAVIIDDPQQVVAWGTQGRSPETEMRATVEWSAPNGTARSSSVEVGPGAQRGDTVDVWVDTYGNASEAPAAAAENAAIAIGAALSVWVGAAAVACLLFFGFRWMNTRNRMRQWDREWKDFGHAPEWPIG
ncbi:hypothetical protein [Rhodococcus sp. NPDC049939]|uniref:Rv1733c family protein n=1 Tax=Rhodococcus sp. NPDC049939 TaxID=3155511 RepID=UPI0033E58D45